jgi:hypothetical protein
VPLPSFSPPHSNTPFSQTIHQAEWRHWSGRSGQRDPRSDSAGSNLESCAAVSLSHPGILHPLPHFRYRGHRYDYRARMKNGEDRAPEPAAQPEFGHRLHRTRIERARLSVLLVFLFIFSFHFEHRPRSSILPRRGTHSSLSSVPATVNSSPFLFIFPTLPTHSRTKI